MRHPIPSGINNPLRVIHTFKHAADVQAVCMHKGLIASGGHDRMVRRRHPLLPHRAGDLPRRTLLGLRTLLRWWSMI